MQLENGKGHSEIYFSKLRVFAISLHTTNLRYRLAKESKDYLRMITVPPLQDYT